MSNQTSSETGRKRPWLWVLIPLVLILLGFLLMWFVSSMLNAAPIPQGNEMSTELAPAESQTVSATASTPEPSPTPTTTVMPTAMLAPSAVAVVPNSIPLLDGNTGAIKGFFYVLNKEGPYTAEYPYQSLIMITLGNGKIENGRYSEALTASETEGNIFADVCAEVGGCSAVISGYTAGHVGVTVIFAGYENPDDSLIGGINNMLEPSNCGGSGCNTVFAHNIKGRVLTFEKKIEAVAVAGFLTPAKPPYVSVNFRYEGVPSGAIVIRDDAKNIIGHEYFLIDKDAFVSVPEGGGTLIYCGAKATIDDAECSPGTVMLFTGAKSDGATPSDLNGTIRIVTTDPSSIRVIMIYAGSFEDQVAQFKAQYPDWDWPE